MPTLAAPLIRKKDPSLTAPTNGPEAGGSNKASRLLSHAQEQLRIGKEMDAGAAIQMGHQGNDLLRTAAEKGNEPASQALMDPIAKAGGKFSSSVDINKTGLDIPFDQALKVDPGLAKDGTSFSMAVEPNTCVAGMTELQAAVPTGAAAKDVSARLDRSFDKGPTQPAPDMNQEAGMKMDGM